MREDLSHVYWIGGTSRAGKSTVAEAIASELGCSVYSHDREWIHGSHTLEADPERHPTMVRYRHLYQDLASHGDFHRFLECFFKFASLKELIEDQFAFFAEEFEMVLDDLRRRPRDSPIIAEGIGLVPEHVSRIADPRRVIYLVSSEAFVQAVEDSPEQKRKRDGWEPWLGRAHLEFRYGLNERTMAQAREHGVRVVETGGRLTIGEVTRLVKAHFGLR